MFLRVPTFGLPFLTLQVLNQSQSELVLGQNLDSSPWLWLYRVPPPIWLVRTVLRYRMVRKMLYNCGHEVFGAQVASRDLDEEGMAWVGRMGFLWQVLASVQPTPPNAKARHSSGCEVGCKVFDPLAHVSFPLPPPSLPPFPFFPGPCPFVEQLR